MRVGGDGSVEILTGASSSGNGLEPMLAEIAEKTLGVDGCAVRVSRTDTAMIRSGGGSFQGRSAVTATSAVLGAARVLERRLRAMAAGLLRTPAEYVERASADFVSGKRRVSYREVCSAACRGIHLEPGLSPVLEETFVFEPLGTTRPIVFHLAQIAIDSETGEVSVERCFNLRDLGHEVDPGIVEGWVHGEIALGIELALRAEASWGDDGQPLRRTLLDYPLATAQTLPRFTTSSLPAPTALNPLGAKGIGDTATIATFTAVMNAIANALRPFGVRHVDPPATPERIWRILRSRRAAGGA